MRIKGEKKERKEYPLNAVRVCIDEAEPDIRGRIYSRTCRECLKFENAAQLLLQTDALLDFCGYPQAFQVKRRFSGQAVSHDWHVFPGPVLGGKEITGQRGKLCTVDIFINTRRRTSWQGCITEEGEKTAEFESELELLRELGRFLEKCEIS